MAQRPLLKPDRWVALLGVPTDEETLIKHYTLTQTELDLVQAKTTAYNQLGLAIQLCLIRHLGRSWQYEELLPAPMVAFVAEQIGVTGHNAGRIWQAKTRTGVSTQSRRSAISGCIRPVARTGAQHFWRRSRQPPRPTRASRSPRRSSPPSGSAIRCCRLTDTLDRIGRAARVVARRRMEASLLDGFTSERLATLDGLLIVDPAIRQTRFAWLRALPEAPSEKNLLALIERLSFVRAFDLDPQRRARIHPDRWDQLVREGAVTPSWLADDFNAGRRRALIAAQLIEMTSKLTDATITMFCRLIARLFTKSKARQDRRHLDDRKETGRLLRMFGDTLRVLAEANETGEDTFKVLDREIGWDRLVQARADVEALATTAEADPLLGAAERYSWVRRYVPKLLEAFTFRSARAPDPLLAAIEFLRQLNRDDRRGLPAKVPLGHLTQKVRKLIAADGKRDRRLWEIATLAVLRERLRSGDVWVEGGRAFCPLETQLMPNPDFAARKAAGDLRLGVPHDADAWIAEKQRELDFKLKKLSYQARTGKLAGVRLVNGVLTISKERTKVPKAKVEAAKWLILDRMPQIDITDLLAEANIWTGFAHWLYPSTHRRRRTAHPGAARGDPRRRDKSRRQAHGRRLGRDQRATDHLGQAVPHPARDLQIGPGRDHQHPSGASFRQALGQRLDLLLGRPVLSRRRPRRQAQRRQRPLQRRSRQQVLHLGLRSVRPLPHPADGRHRG